jgi:pyoverdine/dityrosine biosynthesis protein Dit1
MNIQEVTKILSQRAIEKDFTGFDSSPVFNAIAKTMLEGGPLVFLLPAFPAKSPSQKKAFGKNPDLGEVLALQNLQKMCQEISEIYPAGAQVMICSDGRVFSDVVGVSDEDIDLYQKGVHAIIQDYELDHLKLLSMDDLFPGNNPEELRSLLEEIYCEDLGVIRHNVINDEKTSNLFNGLHRFLKEDQRELFHDMGQNAFNRLMKERAFELLRRSDGWSKLIEEHFRDGIRLSIHPHPITHSKLGIRLVNANSKWATPWHNVLVKFPDRMELMPHKEALDLGAQINFERGRYAFFEAPKS